MNLPTGYTVTRSGDKLVLVAPNQKTLRFFPADASPGEIERAAWSHWRRVDEKVREVGMLRRERRALWG